LFLYVKLFKIDVVFLKKLSYIICLLRLCHGEERRTRNSLSTGSLLLMSGMLSGFAITIFCSVFRIRDILVRIRIIRTFG
jgi:hypothetical protein